MDDIAPSARTRLEAIAAAHGVSVGAATALFQALSATGGTMAQFSHPELGGMGQWSPGMTMVGDMFNAGLKQTVTALCTEIAALVLGQERAAGAAPTGGAAARRTTEDWWPAGLGAAASSGGQNDMRYAYFPAAHRLAVQQSGRVRVYDTQGHDIFGVAQQQGASQSLTFSTERGPVRLEDLRPVDGPA